MKIAVLNAMQDSVCKNKSITQHQLLKQIWKFQTSLPFLTITHYKISPIVYSTQDKLMLIDISVLHFLPATKHTLELIAVHPD